MAGNMQSYLDASMKAIELSKVGQTLAQISAATGLSSVQISDIIDAKGLEKPWKLRKRLRDEASLKEIEVKTKRNLDRDAEIVLLAEAGTTYQEIGKKFNISSERVRVVIKANGGVRPIEIRKQRRDLDQANVDQLQEKIREWVKTHMGCTLFELSFGMELPIEEFKEYVPKDIDHLILDPSKTARRNSWTKEKWSEVQVLDAMRAAANIVTPLPLTKNRYDEMIKAKSVDGPSAVRVIQRFDTWTTACSIAGVEPGETPQIDYRHTWTKNELLSWMVRFITISTTSSIDAYDKWSQSQEGAPSGQTIRNQVGGWADCYHLALLELRRQWAET